MASQFRRKRSFGAHHLDRIGSVSGDSMVLNTSHHYAALPAGQAMDLPEDTALNKNSIDGMIDSDAESDHAVDAYDGYVEIIEISPKLQWATLMSMFWSSTALISEGYNMAIIGNVTLFLKATLPPDVLTTNTLGHITNSFLLGQIFGLLSIGALIDRLGRKAGALTTTLTLLLGIFISTLATGPSPSFLIWMLIFGRGIAGIGAGGEYPVSTAGAAEAADDHATTAARRGFITAAATILCIDFGFVVASLVPMILLIVMDDAQYELIWRMSLGLGAILPFSIFYFRMVAKTSETFSKYGQTKNVSLPYRLIIRKYWKPFVGTAGSWGLYNWVAVPFAIFASTIASELNPSGSLVKNFGYSTLIQMFCLPGGLVGGWCADRYGRKRTLIAGFVLQAALGFLIGGYIRQIQTIPALFLIMYGVFLFLGEAGPGSTVLTISAEAYPTVIRGFMIGLSGAVAKSMAAIATQFFHPILNHWKDDMAKGQQLAFLLGSVFCVLGALLAHFLVEEIPKGENLSRAEAVFEEYQRIERIGLLAD